MKNLLTIIAALLLSIPAFAAIDAMNYQAVVYNTDGTPAANKTIGLSFAILNGDVQVYTETATAQSDANGLVRHAIKGIYGIDWSGSTYWLKVGIDPNGGSNYTILTQSEIMSVPTAAFARKSGDSDELHYMIDRTFEDLDMLNRELYNLEGSLNGDLDHVYNELASLYDLNQSNLSKDEFNAMIRDYATLDELYSNIADLKDYIDHIQIEGSDTAELEARLDAFKTEMYDQLRNYVTIAQLDDQIRRLQEEISNLKIEGGDTEELAKEISNLQNEVTDLYARINTMDAELIGRYYDLRDRQDMMESEMTVLNEMLGNLNDQIAVLKGSIATLSSDMDASRTRITILEDEVARNRNYIEMLEGRTNMQDEEITDLKSMINYLMNEVENLKNK